MKKHFLILFLFVFCFSCLAKSLELDIVLKSSKVYYPEILKTLQDVKRNQAILQSREGAFDLNLHSTYDNRFAGYYDGDVFDVVIEKPLQALNSKFYMGYRKSENSLPSYEGKQDTLDQGESRVGIQLSLWRNRKIDPKRLKLKNAKLKLFQSEAELIYKQNEVLKDASKAYWNWLAKGFVYKINSELLNTMKDQQKAVKKKIKAGALARIYGTENLQYLMKRQSNVLKSYQDFYEASLLLSLFLRDSEGKPLVVSLNELPLKMQVDQEIQLSDMRGDYTQLLKTNPKLIKLNLKLEELSNKSLEAQNALDPKVDLKIESSVDKGEGEARLEQQDHRFFVEVAIPIERNLGQGKKQQISAKKKMVLREKQYLQESLSVQLEKIYSRNKNLLQVISTVQKEVEYAHELEIAERKKFSSGASDLFIVNIRELNAAYAKIKLVNTKYHLNKELAEYRALLLKY